MLAEYALEPSLLSTWPAFQQLVAQFGVEHGRMISRYPGKWKRMVHESLGHCSPIEKHRITESLARIDDRLLPRECNWTNGLDWLDNAEAEHLCRPFHAIIAATNPRTHASVVPHETLDPTAPPPLWAVPRSQIVERTAAKIADVLRPVLQLADRIILVDPHFGAENKRHRVVLQAIVEVIGLGLRGRDWPDIRYVTGNKATPEFFRVQCERELPRRIIAGCKLQIVSAASPKLHNRYVLTDRGGVQLGDGLDECEAGTSRTDCFTLLDRAAASRLLAEYLDDSGLLIAESVVIEGEAV